MSVLYIQRVDFREFVTHGLAQGKNHLTELSFGVSGSRFPLSVPRGEGCVCYIYRGSILGDLSHGGWRKEKII